LQKNTKKPTTFGANCTIVEKFNQNSCLENVDSIFLSLSMTVVLMLLPNLIGILT